jgi:signal transduction histidine kinase
VDLEEGACNAAEVAAYYVISESLTNVAKHSGASRATVTAVSSHGTLFIEIADDGVGGAGLAGGSGLCGLRERVEALGGLLTVASPTRGGTSIAAAIPAR